MVPSVDILNFNVFSETSTSVAVSESPLSVSSATSGRLQGSSSDIVFSVISVSSSVDRDLQITQKLQVNANIILVVFLGCFFYFIRTNGFRLYSKSKGFY